MQTNLTNLTSTRVKIDIEASPTELSSFRQYSIKKLGQNVKVPGFRAGKAPESMLVKFLDPNHLSQETLELAVNSLYGQALISNKLRAVNNPEIKINSYVPYDQLNFEAEVDIIGPIKLGLYKGLGIHKDSAKVSAAEINEVLVKMQNQLATKVEVNRPAKEGDEVSIDFSGVDPKTKELINGADGQDYPLILGSKAFIPGFEDHLIGSVKDAVVDFELTFPADYGVEAMKSKKVLFKVTVKQVNSRKLPKLDDNFAKLVGPFVSLDSLKDDIKKELLINKNNTLLGNQQNTIVDMVVNSSEVDIPQVLIDEEQARIDKEQRHNAAYQGLVWKEYLTLNNLTEDSYTKQLNEMAKIRIKTGLVLGAIANQEKVTIDKTDLSKKLDELKKQYANDKTMQEELKSPNNQQDIQNRLLVEKTVDKLVELNS